MYVVIYLAPGLMKKMLIMKKEWIGSAAIILKKISQRRVKH